MRLVYRSITLSALLMFQWFGAAVLAQESGIVGVEPAISGYSPVSYFTKNKAERGSPEFTVEHEGATYYLTSEEQVEIFWMDPDKYRPRHRSCSYSLAFGMTLPLDPTSFKIIDGSLLLFHLSDGRDSLKDWNESEIDEQELIRRADANLFLIRY